MILTQKMVDALSFGMVIKERLESACAQAGIEFPDSIRKIVEGDEAEALSWIRTEAQQEDAWAQFFLGVIHSCGDGVEQDDAEALKWYKAAAEQGHAGAKFFLEIS